MEVTFGAFRGHFEVTLNMSTSNFMCDACVMHTCTGLVGPKTGKVKKVLVFKAFLKVAKGAGASQECKEAAEKYHPGGGRGRVNLPLVGLFEVLEVWRISDASTRLEARGLGGFIKCPSP